MVVYGASAHGEALCCDATLVAPLGRRGQVHGRAADEDGVALREARRRKATRYPEVGSNGTRLVVLACEVGGRWNDEALSFVRRLVRIRSRQAPPLLRPAVASAFARRWWSMLSIAVQDALSATLLGLPLGPLSGCGDSAEPFTADVLTTYGGGGGSPSRLPLRA